MAAPHKSLPQVGEPTPRPELVPDGPQVQRAGSRGWLWVLAGLLLGAGLYVARESMLTETAAPVAATPSVVVQEKPFVESIRLTGSVSAQDSAAIRAPRLQVRSQLTLTELAEPGTFVKAGDTVARFESQELQDRVDDMKSNVVQARTQVEREKATVLIEREALRQERDRAKGELDKARFDLRKAEVLSEIQAEILRYTAQEAEATWRQIEREMELQEEVFARRIRVQEIAVADAELRYQRYARDLEQMTLRAPVGGLVVLEPMYKGGGVFQQASMGDQVYPGTVFLRVVDLSGLVVSAEVNQVDAQSIRVGQPVKIYFDAYPELTLDGRVSNAGAIAGSASSVGSRGGSGLYVKTIPIEIAFETSDPRVIPDLSVAADVEISRQDPALTVPVSAVRREGGESTVWVKRGKDWKRAAIELGARNEVEAVVLSGLAPGDEVALQIPERP